MRKRSIEFQEHRLQNGLNLILHKDNSNPIATIYVWYLVGSKDEDPGHTGFAHLFEHMMFQGSKNVGKAEHFLYINKAGGTLNGTTSFDRTNYFETIPSNQIELALWLESDRMSQLAVTQENFNNQREVVKEEKRRNYDNRPYGSWSMKMFNKSFPAHPYFMVPIGSMEDLNAASLNYAQEFYKRFYSPNNAVLVISGDIDYAEAKKLVEKYFGDLAPTNHLPKPAQSETNRIAAIQLNKGEVRDTFYENVQLPALFIGYKTHGVSSKDHYSLELLSYLLGQGRSSRLYKNLVYEKKIAKSAEAYIFDLQLAGLFVFEVFGLHYSSLEEIEEAVNSQIELLKTVPVSNKELEKVKNAKESYLTKSAETTLGKADMIANYYILQNNADLINSDIENYLKLMPNDIMKAANKYLNPENRVVLRYLPKTSNVKSEK